MLRLRLRFTVRLLSPPRSPPYADGRDRTALGESLATELRPFSIRVLVRLRLCTSPIFLPACVDSPTWELSYRMHHAPQLCAEEDK